MIVWIQKNTEGYCSTHNIWLAYDGFAKRGIHFKDYLFSDLQDGKLPLNPEEDIVVGGVLSVHLALEQMGCAIPDPMDYPEILQSFLGRKIVLQEWADVEKYIYRDNFANPIFVKPKYQKVWNGRLIKDFTDLIKIGNPNPDYPVWVSEPMAFESEYRTMVLKNEIRSVDFYKGDCFIPPDRATIEEMVKLMAECDVAAYSLDVGVVDGKTYLVEANDSYALGSYNSQSLTYSLMVEARWQQLRKFRSVK